MNTLIYKIIYVRYRGIVLEMIVHENLSEKLSSKIVFELGCRDKIIAILLD